MNNLKITEDKLFSRRWHWLGIIIVSLLSIPLHFTYEWLGENPIVGMFTPINESIWEHLKLVYWPLLTWWAVGYLIYKDKKKLDLNKWVVAGTLAIIITMMIITSWYYVWVSALATESSIIDIGSLFIAVPIGQLVGIHTYRVVKARPIYSLISAILLIAFAVMFIYFTFSPADLPLFISNWANMFLIDFLSTLIRHKGFVLKVQHKYSSQKYNKQYEIRKKSKKFYYGI